MDARLGDRLMGELELLTTPMIEARFPAEVARRRDAETFAYCPPGGESYEGSPGHLRLVEYNAVDHPFDGIARAVKRRRASR